MYTWISFKQELFDKQPLPPEKRYVLVQTDKNYSLPPAVAVGYLKYGAGEKDSPYFVIPGIGGKVLFWADCLGDDFNAPAWEGKQRCSTVTE